MTPSDQAGQDRQGAPDSLDPHSASARVRSPWPLRLMVLGGVLLVAVGLVVGASALLRPSSGVGSSAAIPPANSRAVEALDYLSSGPVTFEHVLHAGRYGAQNVGRGYLDVSSDCVLDASYVGPIYQVELLRVDGLTWQRSYKQPTRMRGDWAQSSPLSGSVNSVVSSLTGAASSTLCGLRDLPLVLSDYGQSYTVNWDAVLALESSRRAAALESELVAAGWPPEAARDRVASLDWALNEDLLSAAEVRIESSSSGSGQIVILDSSGAVLEEVMFWPADRQGITPPTEPLTSAERAEQARRIVGDPPQ